MNSARLLPLFTALALAGCAADFEPGSDVTSLRVLAVQADHPFAHPGETVRLQALSYDPLDRALTWAWAACPNPASSSVEDCFAQAGAIAASGATPLLALGVGIDHVELPIPDDALDVYEENTRSQALSGVLSVACPGELALRDSSSGLPFVCTDRDTGAELGLHDMIVGIKRVFLRETDVNQNPVISQVLFDGEAWAADDIKQVGACDTDGHDYDKCKGADHHQLAAVVRPDSFEAGPDELGHEFSEEVIVQHYATNGIFKDQVRLASAPETSWVATRSASGSTLTLWFVARDDRGGVAWASRQVQVE
jgi:hypothetical protein